MGNSSSCNAKDVNALGVCVQGDQPCLLALRYCSGDHLDDTRDQLMLKLDTWASHIAGGRRVLYKHYPPCGATPIDCSVVPGAPANSPHEFKPFNLTGRIVAGARAVSTPESRPKRQIMTWPDEPPSESATKFERCLLTNIGHASEPRLVVAGLVLASTLVLGLAWWAWRRRRRQRQRRRSRGGKLIG